MYKDEDYEKKKNYSDLKKIGQKDIGFLSIFEAEKEIPFKIKRIYYIYQVPKGVKRGMHAHIKLEQALWCPYGEIEIILYNGKKKTKYILNSPEKILYVGSGIWRDMFWIKENSVLCVAASEYYNESDYIRDYNDYLKMYNVGYWKPAKRNSEKNKEKQKPDNITLKKKIKEFRKENRLRALSIKEVLKV